MKFITFSAMKGDELIAYAAQLDSAEKVLSAIHTVIEEAETDQLSASVWDGEETDAVVYG